VPPWTIKGEGALVYEGHTHSDPRQSSSQAIQLIVDVGYYALVARTTLNHCVLVFIHSVRQTSRPPPHLRITVDALCHPAGGFPLQNYLLQSCSKRISKMIILFYEVGYTISVSQTRFMEMVKSSAPPKIY
jgi:hypothetical protein